MLLPRFLTAVFGLPLILFTIWWGQIPFLVMVFGIVLLALYEYYNLAECASLPVFKSVGLVCGGIFSLGICFLGTSLAEEWGSPIRSVFLPLFLAFTLALFSFFNFFSRKKENAFIALSLMWFGNFYVAWTLSHLYLLREMKPEGLYYTYFLFFVIWALDIGAYLGGIRFGRRRLSEYISPKKTWEGAVVGSVTALGAATLCKVSFSNFLNLTQTLILATVIILVAQVSDLSESLFKRNVGVKDSGNLLPGHGGILDRFDSFLLTTPLYYYLLVFFLNK